ncbi:hypothetical protein MYSTI_07624 [Myxococcus stipitatus DSM 14675]|uniref:Uncharacterized protein n=1 Tax=Myxococcus stipitatus (strain DSM 14675 / JCM 12634 / Mx s8) TaxID=1278073 RepID=L7UIU5_MYXSD|nr:hypothetical protein MYSTI_07624 [Myxococcus stipitatus DSM 14675]
MHEGLSGPHGTGLDASSPSPLALELTAARCFLGRSVMESTGVDGPGAPC